jgi:hypothetical protein
MGAPVFANVIGYFIFGLFFIVGLINFINPRFMWKINDSWKATREPPQSYFFIRRIGGLIAMLIPVVWLCFVYYMAHKQ